MIVPGRNLVDMYPTWIRLSIFPAVLALSICLTLTGTYCKPLQQQSNDRSEMGDYGLVINDGGRRVIRAINSDLYVIRRPSGSNSNLDKLTATMDALQQFRRVIDHRLLINNRLPEEGDQHQTRVHKHSHRKGHGRTHEDATQTGAYQRDQRGDPGAYRIGGLNVKAHLERASVPPERRADRERGEEPEERYLTGGTTAIDEQQLRVFSEMAQSDTACPRLHGKTTHVLCPSRGRHGYRVCVPDTALCNDHIDCPNGEDEDPVNCLFYKTTIHHFRLVVDAVVELSDLVKEQERRRAMDEL